MNDHDTSHDASAWSRRTLFSARGFGATTGGVLRALLDEKTEGPGDPTSRVSFLHVARTAMACEFSIYLLPDMPNALGAARAGLDEIDRMEDLLTVYRDDSPMCYVNAHAASRPVRVDERMMQVLRRSAELTDATDGAFDVATHALIRAWGFFRGPRRVPEPAERQAAMAASGMRHVRLDAERRTVAFDVEGLGINLGSIGKGYAIDHAVRLLEKEHGVTTALMQGGSSSLLALGAPSGMPLGWRVGIENPLDRTQRLATVRLRDRALGTASAADQYFEVDGRRYGHILDPRTGVPAETDVISASAIARDAATADALATAFFVAGLDKTARFCQDHRDIGAVLVLRGDPQAAADEPLRVRTFNVPKEEIDLSPEPMVATRDTASLMGMASVGLEPMVTR